MEQFHEILNTEEAVITWDPAVVSWYGRASCVMEERFVAGILTVTDCPGVRALPATIDWQCS